MNTVAPRSFEQSRRAFYGCATDSIRLDKALMKIKPAGRVVIPLQPSWWQRVMRRLFNSNRSN